VLFELCFKHFYKCTVLRLTAEAQTNCVPKPIGVLDCIADKRSLDTVVLLFIFSIKRMSGMQYPPTQALFLTYIFILLKKLALEAGPQKLSCLLPLALSAAAAGAAAQVPSQVGSGWVKGAGWGWPSPCTG